MSASSSPSSEAREWIQTVVGVVTAGFGIFIGLGLNENVKALLDPEPRFIVSDGTWKASAKFEKGWRSINFPDHNWQSAWVLSLSKPLAANVTAPMIWAHGDSVPTCYLRKVFEVSKEQLDRFRSAVLVASVDDEIELSVNGERLALPKADGASISAVDIYPWLVEDKNVVAVEGHNKGGDAGVTLRIAFR